MGNAEYLRINLNSEIELCLLMKLWFEYFHHPLPFQNWVIKIPRALRRHALTSSYTWQKKLFTFEIKNFHQQTNIKFFVSFPKKASHVPRVCNLDGFVFEHLKLIKRFLFRFLQVLALEWCNGLVTMCVLLQFCVYLLDWNTQRSHHRVVKSPLKTEDEMERQQEKKKMINEIRKKS